MKNIQFLSVLILSCSLLACSFVSLTRSGRPTRRIAFDNLRMQVDGLRIDMRGKIVFVAGVADSSGYGWAIAKSCAEAGAKVLVGTWPPVLSIFQAGLNRGNFDKDRMLSDGTKMEFAKIYPFDATFDTRSAIPQAVAADQNNQTFIGYSIQEIVDQVKDDFGNIDYVVHSLANGPEVTKPLLETTRQGYLAASSASAYSLVSMVQRFGPILNPGSNFQSFQMISSN